MARPTKGFTLLELLVVVTIIALLVGLLLPAMARARGEARKAVCKSNMKNFGLAISMYSNDYNEVYPTRGLGLTVGVDDLRGLGSMCLLYDSYITAKRIFQCPSTTDNASDLLVGLNMDRAQGLITAKPAGNSYAYDSQKPPQADPGTAIAADRHDPNNRLRNSPNHGNAGQNVLYYDGHVEWAPTPNAGLNNDHIWAHWDYRPGPNVLACSDSYITQ